MKVTSRLWAQYFPLVRPINWNLVGTLIGLISTIAAWESDRQLLVTLVIFHLQRERFFLSLIYRIFALFPARFSIFFNRRAHSLLVLGEKWYMWMRTSGYWVLLRLVSFMKSALTHFIGKTKQFSCLTKFIVLSGNKLLNFVSVLTLLLGVCVDGFICACGSEKFGKRFKRICFRTNKIYFFCKVVENDDSEFALRCFAQFA